MSSVLGTYTRKNISFSEGKGCYLYDLNGEKYLDFVSGIAVNSLGHCHEHLVKIIQEQSQKGISISVEEIEVLNLAGRLQGHITLNCEKIDYETDREIIGSIAEKLIAEYPNEFAENSERDSWVDINGCSEMGTSPDGINTYYHTTTWRISEGYYDALI